ncbi:MAG: hypothetical protein U1E50_05960 [Caulobacteraceae bacterium]
MSGETAPPAEKPTFLQSLAVFGERRMVVMLVLPALPACRTC